VSIPPTESARYQVILYRSAVNGIVPCVIRDRFIVTLSKTKKKEGIAIQPSANVASICSYIQNIPQIHKQLATNAYLSFTSQLRIKAA
jgi:hypothetical protein